MRLLPFLLAVVWGVTSSEAEQAWVSMSKVGGFKGFKGQVALFGVKESLESLSLEFRGPGADSFVISEARKEENNLLFLEIEFQPTAERGYFSAELMVGTGEKQQLVQLRGVATQALEGKNEPPLQELLKAFGTAIDAGGDQLALSTREQTIGDSIAASQFEPVKNSSVTITPLARYSPRGETPFGLVIPEGKELLLQSVDALAATTPTRPDSHQAIRPPLASGQPAVTLADPPQRFGLFLKAHQYTSLTLPGRATRAPIKHTARIYPVRQFEGKILQNAYVVGFEEASNGDYQDAVFLIEGVRAVK